MFVYMPITHLYQSKQQLDQPRNPSKIYRKGDSLPFHGLTVTVIGLDQLMGVEKYFDGRLKRKAKCGIHILLFIFAKLQLFSPSLYIYIP